MATKPVLVDDSTSYTKPVTPNSTPTQPSNGNITTMSTKPSQVNIGGVMMDVDAVKSKLGNVLTGAINASTPTNTTASSAPTNTTASSAPSNPTPTQPTQPNPQPTAPSAPDFNGMLQNQANAQFSQQQAMLGKARDEQIAQLQKAYADAVAEGTISVRDAEEAFRKQSEVINQQAYQNSQATNLSAESRGIGNSQQMLGLMQGDNARKNSMINENMTTRDKRVSDIQDRIKSLTTKRDLDIAGANANYNYGLASAKGQIDANMFGKMFDVQHEEYTANRNNQFDLNKMNIQHNYDLTKMDKQQVHVLDQMAKQYGYDINKMDKQQLYTLDQMAQSQGYDLQKLAVQQGYTQANMKTQQNYDLQKMNVQQKNVLAQMAKQQGYDLAKMSQAQINDLAKLATQHGYNMTMQNDAQSHDSSMQANQIAAQKAISDASNASAMARLEKEMGAKQNEYLIERERALRGVTPGTPEYDIAMGQINMKQQAEMQSWLKEQSTKGEFKSLFPNGVMTNPPTAPTRPGANPLDFLFLPSLIGKAGELVTYGKDSKQYESDKAMYDAQQRWLQQQGLSK